MRPQRLVVLLGLLVSLGAPARGQPSTAPSTQARPSTAEEWVALLRSDAPADQDRAGEALVQLGRAAERPLLAAVPSLAGRAAGVAFGVLVTINAPGALQVLIDATTHPQLLRRQAAAGYLSYYKDDPRAQQALLRLVHSEDVETAGLALGALRGGGPLAAWSPVFHDVVVRRLQLEPQSPLIARGLEALRSILTRHGTGEHVVELLRACAALEPAEGARLFSVIADAHQATVTGPFLLRIFGERGADGGLPSSIEEALLTAQVDEAFNDDATVAFCERPEVRAAAVRGLGRANPPGAEPTIRRALLAPESLVRAAALGVLRVPSAATSLEREEVLSALIVLLTDPDRRVRAVAHHRLREATDERLPLSAPKWVEWFKAERVRVAWRRELEVVARDSGYDDVEAFLKDYPEEAPPPRQAPDLVEEERE